MHNLAHPPLVKLAGARCAKARGCGSRHLLLISLADDKESTENTFHMDQQPDHWSERVGSFVLAGFLLMCGGFLFFLGTYGALHDTRQHKDLINKGVIGAPVFFYFAVYLIVESGRTTPASERELTRWQWARRHWMLCLGCLAVEVVVLSGWVTYLNLHGFHLMH
jgi:hypothetical protein